MDVNFLDSIEISELEGKDEVVKSIRFSKDEFYMLKYCTYINKRFATFVKELMDKEIRNEVSTVSNIDIYKLKEELKQELREELREELLEELRSEINSNSSSEWNSDTSYVGKNALLDFMGKGNMK